MRENLKITGSILMRRKNLISPYLILLVALAGYALKTILNSGGPAPMDTDEYLECIESICKVGIGAYALFLYLGYELHICIRCSDLQETVESMPGALIKSTGAATVWLAVMAMGCTVIVMIFNLIMFCQAGCSFSIFLWNLLALVLYFFMIPWMAGMMGMALERLMGTKRLLVYAVVVLLVLLNTTYMDRILDFLYWSGQRSTLEAILPWRVKEWFTFTPYGMDFMLNGSMYGIPQEFSRWILCLFWMSVSVAVMLPGTIISCQRKRTAVVLCCIAPLVLGVIFASRGFLWSANESQISPMWMEEQIYAQTHPVEEESGGFEIQSYDMELTVFQKLHADLTMEVGRLTQERQEYVFTLHRYLTIGSLTTEKGQGIPYSREGNIFRFDRSYLPEGGMIRIRYSGAFPAYYSNEQALALPSWFPYYPMEGIRPLEKKDQIGHSLELPQRYASYRVRVHAPYRVYSNLPGQENCFEGESRGLTLAGGIMMKHANISGMDFVLAAEDEENKIAASLQQIQRYMERVNVNLGGEPNASVLVPISEMYDTIFAMPGAGMNNRVMSEYVDQEDHLWVGAGFLLHSESMVCQMLNRCYHPQNGGYWLTQTWNRFLIGEEYDLHMSISDDPEYWMKKLEDFSRADPNKRRQSDLIALVYKNCLEYIREHGDGSEMMQIYEWLQKPAEECETDEFILIRDMMREVMDKSE